MVISVRQSYLSPTLRLLKRPVLSDYGDIYLKNQWYLRKKQTLSFILLGSYDTSKVNEAAPNSPANQFVKATTSQRFHQHATTALKYQRFKGDHYTTIILSHYGIQQRIKKQNQEPDIFYTQRDYHASDSRTALRVEQHQTWQSGAFTFGGNLYQHHSRAHFTVDWTRDNLRNLNYRSWLYYNRWSGYLQITQRITPRWIIKTGLRYEGSDYSPRTRSQFSPRLVSYFNFSDRFRLYAHAALYHQMPENLSLALRDSNEQLINRHFLQPFTVQHLSLGMEWQAPRHSAFRGSLAAFHKSYRYYPVSKCDGIALINKGDGFTLIGNEPLLSNGAGRAYGVELTLHLPSLKGFYGLTSYSLIWSEFQQQQTQTFLPSAVDTRHVVNLHLGKNFSDHWHIGLVGRIQSGRPYTPWDIKTSSSLKGWNESLSTGIPDYTRLNSERLSSNLSVDLRIDKKFTLKNSDIKVIFEILNFTPPKQQQGRPVLILDRNLYGQPAIAPGNGNHYRLRQVESELFLFVPSIGLNIEF
jgi:hypothetical protein